MLTWKHVKVCRHNCFFSDFLRDESAHSADSARYGTRLNLALFSRQIWLAVVVDKNAKTWGVQSNLQSHFNYRSKNMRLEMKFFKKSDKSKWLSKFFSANSFYILNWRSYIKNLVRNTFSLKILKISISSLCILVVFYFWGPWCFERLMKIF